MRSCAERVLTVTSRLNFPITIDTTGVTIQATQVKVTASATMTLNGGGDMTLTAGMIAIN